MATIRTAYGERNGTLVEIRKTKSKRSPYTMLTPQAEQKTVGIPFHRCKFIDKTLLAPFASHCSNSLIICISRTDINDNFNHVHSKNDPIHLILYTHTVNTSIHCTKTD